MSVPAPQQPPEWLHDPEVMVFASESGLDLGAAQQHGIGEWLADLFGRSREEVRQDWEKVLDQIRFLLDNATASAKGYELDEITFQLGFSAEGQVVFVAKAGVTTTISAKFTRTPG